MSEKFCSGCRRWKPEHLIKSKRIVKHKTGQGSTTHYLCVPCAEKQRVRIAKSQAVAHG